VQIEAPSGISGMRRALVDAVEAGKNVQLNLDNAGDMQYSEGGNKSVVQDRQLRDMMERMSRNEFVSEQDVVSSPTIKEAKRRSDAAAQHPTIENNSAERQTLRDDCTIALLDLGSAQYDANGKIVKGADGETAYGGAVEQGHHIDIVVGLPAAGKSSVLVDPLSAQHHARVIDNDMAKAMLPEFDNGIGAGAVHEESKVISKEALRSAMNKGDNIVLPIVGGNYEKLVAQIEQFRALGYEVAVHLCDLPSNKAIGRAIGRYLNTGRYIPMDVLYGYGNKPKENFYRLVQEGIIHEYSEYSNDVGYGEPPRPIRQSAADAGGTGDQRQGERNVAQDVRRSGWPAVHPGGSGRDSEAHEAVGSDKKSEKRRELTEPENKLARYGAVQDGGDKGRSRVIENTLKNSPVFGGVFQDVRDEMLEQNKNAARYNVLHEVDSMAEAAERIQADPKGEAEYLLTDNDGHVWSAPDIDTAMGLIASNQLDGDAARAVAVVISFLTASAIRV
jgi:hypothetical protein